MRVARTSWPARTTRLTTSRACPGYASASAFAKVFREEYKSSPSEYRRGKKGPARAGGATGAFARSESTWRPGIDSGWWAIWQQKMDEARVRIEDRNWLERFGDNRSAFAGLQEEVKNPRHLRHDPQHWHERHQALAKWIGANEPLPAEQRPFGAARPSGTEHPLAVFHKP